VTYTWTTQAIASSSCKVAGLLLQGILFNAKEQFPILSRPLLKGRFPEKEAEIILGNLLAEQLNIQVGEHIQMIIPFGSEDEQLFCLTAQVVGLIKMGMYQYDSKLALVPLQLIQNILNQPEKVSSFFIQLQKGSSLQKASKKLHENFSFPFRIKDWSQLNKNLFYSLQLEKAMIGIVIFAIVIIASLNIISVLTMMIHDKIKEIAILRVMGFSFFQIFWLFCGIGLSMGSLGSLLGVLCSLGIMSFFKHVGLIHLPSDIYHLSFLPVRMNWQELSWIILLSEGIAFFTSLYPAWRIARCSPLDGIRDHS